MKSQYLNLIRLSVLLCAVYEGLAGRRTISVSHFKETLDIYNLDKFPTNPINFSSHRKLSKERALHFIFCVNVFIARRIKMEKV